MHNKKKRLMLHSVGAALLLCCIPIGMRFGLLALCICCVLALVCFVVAGFVDTEPKSRNRLPYVCPYQVEFDDLQIRVMYNGKPHEEVKWSELMVVGVRIDESFLPAPWWILFGSGKRGCMYPSEASGAGEMLREMQARLANFDNAAVIEAMGLMAGGRVVWSKPDTEPDQAVFAADLVNS
jgi:hypothetical protein